MRHIRCDTWPQFRELIDAERGNYPAYWRGQMDPLAPLASSFERTILLQHGGSAPGASMVYPYDGRYLHDGQRVWSQGAIRGMRDRFLSEFRTAASGLRGPNPASLTLDQWWALGRHYGLVSPLLDWSEKPYIAAFFVLVGMFDLPRDEGGLPEPAREGVVYRLEHSPRLEGDGLRVVRVMVDELGRLNNQRGAFTWMDSEEYFELQGFLDNTGRGELLWQITLSPDLVVAGLTDLSAHGVDYRMIYPDLTGAALYANTRWDF